MFLSKLLYQRCVAGGKFNWEYLNQDSRLMQEVRPLMENDSRWKKAMRTIRPFLGEAKGQAPQMKVLPIHCVNRCPSGNIMYQLGLHRNPFVLLGFSNGKYLLGDLSESRCSPTPELKPVIYGFDGILIWDLFLNAESSTWALIYRNKSVITGGGGSFG